MQYCKIIWNYDVPLSTHYVNSEFYYMSSGLTKFLPVLGFD